MSPILLAAATMGERIDSVFYNFDLWVFSFFGNMQCDFLTYVAKLFTSLGDEMFVIPMVLLGIVLCLFKKTRKYGVSIVIAIAVGTIITNVVVKPMFLRVRPYNTLQGVAEYWGWYTGAGMLSEGDYSFPSGHTTAAFEMATAMFLCFRSDKKKIAWLFPVLAFCVLGSRVYLMVHYATDVLAGLIIGTIAGTIGYLCTLIVAKIKFIDKMDAGKLFKKVKPVVGTVIIVVFVCGILGYNYGTVLSEGGDDTLRCAYNEEYECQNEAKTDDEKYPAIDGQRYCKIHWKQLSGVEE